MSALLPPARRIGILANMGKPDVSRVLRETTAWLLARSVDVAVPPDLAEAVGPGVRIVPLPEIGGVCDVVISIGGDGTLIGAARALGASGTPVLGVNLGGKLGFLTELDAADVPGIFQGLLDGGVPVEERMNVRVVIRRDGRDLREITALNDCSVNRGDLAGILEFSVHVGAEYLGTFLADGVIVSTPTGSTAYSLSAGGPILHPEMRALVVTPICPHALSLRPLVLGSDHEVEVRVVTPGGMAHVSVDGLEGTDLAEGDRVLVASSPRVTRLVRLAPRSFYARLREKFEWGGWRSGDRGARLAP